MSAGALVISLDFELAWGLRGFVPEASWRRLSAGARSVVPRLLEAFERHEVHATWATVGLLMCEGPEQAVALAPEVRPRYRSPGVDSYVHLGAGWKAADTPLHFAPDLVRLIGDVPGQEVGTHTFGHYYCLEDGHTDDAFRADLAAADWAARLLGVTLRSIVFPRNQAEQGCLVACADAGLTAYRGTQPGWRYQARTSTGQWRRLRSVLRLVDEYSPLFGDGCYAPSAAAPSGLRNFPASRLFRPSWTGGRVPSGLQLSKVLRSMDRAARHGLVYHLWWHPHNFALGSDTKLAALGRVLEHFTRLRAEHGFESLTMAEAAARPW